MYNTVEYRSGEQSRCNLKFGVPKEIPTVFYNGSNNDYHFIIKKLAEEFEEQFTYLGKNTEKKNNFCSFNRKRVYKN